MPDEELARRFRTALYQESHLVPERVFAERILNLLATAQRIIWNLRSAVISMILPGQLE